MTIEAQLGLIGGTMGLLTGFSILSGVEIIFYLFRSFSCSCNLKLARTSNDFLNPQVLCISQGSQDCGCVCGPQKNMKIILHQDIRNLENVQESNQSKVL